MIRRDFKVFSLFASWFGPEMRLRNRFITIAIKDSRKTQKLGSSIERLFHRE
jgi:hypothetical protein